MNDYETAIGYNLNVIKRIRNIPIYVQLSGYHTIQVKRWTKIPKEFNIPYIDKYILLSPIPYELSNLDLNKEIIECVNVEYAYYAPIYDPISYLIYPDRTIDLSNRMISNI